MANRASSASQANSGLLGTLFGLVVLLPWWLGVVFAVAAYFCLHAVAGASPQADVIAAVAGAYMPAKLGGFVIRQVLTSLALYGQYIVPIVILGAALGSWLRRRSRAAIFTGVARSTADNPLNNISWRQFEYLVGEVFRRKGYAVFEIGGGGPDGGIDLELRKDRERFLVQCKQWRALKVSVNIVRELYGVMAARGAAGGFVVTSGAFTNESWAFANGRNIELIDGQALRSLIRQIQAEQTPAPATPASAATTLVAEPYISELRIPESRTPEPRIHMPACPRCGSTMTRRIAKSGSNAGKPFLGCTRFPDCRYIRVIEQGPAEEMAIKTW
jgi:restriction system protein